MQRRASVAAAVVLVGVLTALGVTRGHAPRGPATVTDLLRETNEPALHRSLVFLQDRHRVVPADLDDRGIAREPLRFVTHGRGSYIVLTVCDGGFAGRAPAAQVRCGLADAVRNQR